MRTKGLGGHPASRGTSLAEGRTPPSTAGYRDRRLLSPSLWRSGPEPQAPPTPKWGAIVMGNVGTQPSASAQRAGPGSRHPPLTRPTSGSRPGPSGLATCSCNTGLWLLTCSLTIPSPSVCSTSEATFLNVPAPPASKQGPPDSDSQLSTAQATAVNRSSRGLTAGPSVTPMTKASPRATHTVREPSSKRLLFAPHSSQVCSYTRLTGGL